MRAEFVDPKRSWHGYSYLPVALGYNKRYVKESELPKNYDDLLLPTWKGRLSLDKDDGDIFRVFFDAWGEDRVLQYFKRLANQQIEFRSGHTLQAQLLAAGEIAAAPWLYSHRLMMLMDNGAPVGLLFLDPVVSVPKMFMLARRAQHPYAAALFIDWALSSEAQHFVGMTIGRSPARRGQQQRYPKLGDPKTFPMTPELLGANFDRYAKLYREIFALK
jgi:iron(III) transport system substrate-binding protein